MSILIKGMEMPKHAGVNEDKDTVYRCIVIAHPDNSAELVIDTEFASPYDNGHNVKRCPLVEVPTPHGRLIDVQGISDLENKYCQPCIMRQTGVTCSTCILCDFLEELAELPTIIEAEVSEG